MNEVADTETVRRIGAQLDAAVHIQVPSSKPETQRALLTAALADGTSTIYNDLRCRETSAMVAACEAIGARIEWHEDRMIVTGVGGLPDANRAVTIVQAHGSGLVFRVFTALGSVLKGPVAITGDAILRRRPMGPLIESLRALGASIEYLGDEGCAPVIVNSDRLTGGTTHIAGDISSQFITALLLAAPFAQAPTQIRVTGTILSQSYIRQTLAAMRESGIDVSEGEGGSLSELEVKPGCYKPHDSFIHGDFTSASYLLAAAALYPGRYVLGNMTSDSLQGERTIVDIVRQLGVALEFDEDRKLLHVWNKGDGMRGDHIFDVSDSPNIVPTLAALGSFVDGSFTVTGGSITRLHKSPRIQAMVTELRKLGVDITPTERGGVVDGFCIRGDGRPLYGGIELDGWSDHRIVMSLHMISGRCLQRNTLRGEDSVDSSFPGFFEAFEALVKESHLG
ncbi:MAG: 3-phosphoshikimate 1-carboxyvinyltransferase [Burkholderiaceae bacterium]